MMIGRGASGATARARCSAASASAAAPWSLACSDSSHQWCAMRAAYDPVPLASSRAASSAAVRQSRARSARPSRASRASVSKAVPSSAWKAAVGAVEQPGLDVVLGQCVLCSCAVAGRQVGALQQMLVHPHRAFEFAAAAKQVAEREVKLRRVGVALHRLDEGVDRLVVLFVEQQVQALEVGLRRLLLGALQLAEVEARGDPSQRKGHRQADQQPLGIEFEHRSGGAGPFPIRRRAPPGSRDLGQRAGDQATGLRAADGRMRRPTA